MQIAQYNFQDNPNLPRILDSLKRDYDIDVPLDYVIEQVGQCLRLIGGKTYYREAANMTIVNGAITLPCYVEKVEQVTCGLTSIPFHFKGNNVITFDSHYNNKQVKVVYTIYLEDSNGFPQINSEEEYYACYHWILYQHFQRLFAKKLDNGDRLQWFKELKDKYILQARAVTSNSELQTVVNNLYSVYNRHTKSTDANSSKYRK